MAKAPSAKVSADAWAEREAGNAEFGDARLAQRFRRVLKQLTAAGEPSIPFACQDAAQSKAAYRFFSNPRVNEWAILSGHMRCTRDRTRSISGPFLVLHDTTEISYGSNEGNIGLLSQVARKTICGLLMHSSLVVTPEGLPLGIAAVKFWTRNKFKGTNALKRQINPTRIPIEQKESIRWLQNVQQSTALLGCPDQCIHVGDRECDIYELFCAAQERVRHTLSGAHVC
jgi:hypothetical protein